MNENLQFTDRGFGFYEFKDRNNNNCSLQESSLIDEEQCIWLGCDENAKPHPTLGVEMSPRMHLTQTQARWLAKKLIHFAKTGNLTMEKPKDE